jgi:hypothetical protein
LFYIWPDQTVSLGGEMAKGQDKGGKDKAKNKDKKKLGIKEKKKLKEEKKKKNR